jgi:hypothetical protein
MPKREPTSQVLRKSKWSMKADRKLIELAKTKTLETIAGELQLSPVSILRKAAKLGLTMKRKRSDEE